MGSPALGHGSNCKLDGYCQHVAEHVACRVLTRCTSDAHQSPLLQPDFHNGSSSSALDKGVSAGTPQDRYWDIPEKIVTTFLS